tara:strand:- start:287 stop:568 length:282 start_codon:yes stop_codon:yes gene_type:complete
MSASGDSDVQIRSKFFDIDEVCRISSIFQTLSKKVEMLLHPFLKTIAFTIILTNRVAALSTTAHLHPNLSASVYFARRIDFEMEAVAFIAERH